MYLQGEADLDRVVEGRFGQAGLQALVQAGQQRGARLSLPAALQGPEHLRSRLKPDLDAARMQHSGTRSFGCLWGMCGTMRWLQSGSARHAGGLNEALRRGGLVGGSSQESNMAKTSLMGSGCEVPRGALQQPAHGLCSPAPSDVLLKVQHIHLWQMSCDRRLNVTLQGPYT